MAKCAAKTKWQCPKCGATENQCGRGVCKIHSPPCAGLLCECPNEEPSKEHGESFADRCTDAICYHCGWAGQMPPTPKGIAPWEKKALEAGWKPPPERARELSATKK